MEKLTFFVSAAKKERDSQPCLDLNSFALKLAGYANREGLRPDFNGICHVAKRQREAGEALLKIENDLNAGKTSGVSDRQFLRLLFDFALPDYQVDMRPEGFSLIKIEILFSTFEDLAWFKLRFF
jgi:hypothetical protein